MTRRTAPPDPVLDLERRRRVRLVLAAALGGTFLILLVFATIGLLLGPPKSASTPMVGRTTAPEPTHSDEQPRENEAAPFGEVAQTGDADRFAWSVALSIFGWDTRDGFLPTDYVQSVLDQASDPGNDETDGLSQDLSSYLPNPAAWRELQRYETRQHLEIDRIEVPSGWGDVERQAREGTLLPGTVAYTVDGTRHRAGVWDGEQVSTEHPVAFTLFIACEPSYDECRLLRLTALDKPLR